MIARGRIAVVVFALFGCAALVFLWAMRRDRSSTGTPSNPFVFVVSPAHATTETAHELELELASRSGLAVRVEIASPGAGGVSRTGTQAFDAGLLPLFEYLLARQEYGVEAKLQTVRHGSRTYSGVLVVREDSQLRAITDLRGHRVAFVDASSTTGHLLPQRALREAGVDVDATFTGSHDAAIAAVRAGTADAAATFAAPRDGLRVIATTGSVPDEPVFFSPRVPTGVRDRITFALVDLASTPEGRALLTRIADIDGFASVTDDAYHEVHGLLRGAGRELPDLVAGGRQLVEWNRLPASGLAP